MIYNSCRISCTPANMALPPPPKLKGLADPAIHGPAFSWTADVWGNSKVAVTEHDTHFTYRITVVY